MAPKFTTRFLSAVMHGMMMFIVGFFGGLLIEATLNVMGALAAYNIPQFTIPSLCGTFGFLNSIAYEMSRRLDEEQ